jgi:F0F1-type ATP synthase assembly protein I
VANGKLVLRAFFLYDKSMEGLGLATKLGISIVILVLAGVGSGYGLDQLFHSSPLFLLIGSMIGIVFALYAMFALTRDYREPLRKKKPKIQK